jgi:hypothetical protein
MNTSTIISLILFLIIFVALYQTYFYLNPKVLNDGTIIPITQPTTQFDISVSEIEDPSSIRYFYDGWLRVNGVPDSANPYVIFNRGKEFVVTLTGHVLSVMNYRDSATDIKTAGGCLSSSDKKAVKIVDIATNFPFQRWVHFCINVDENRMDVYLNGKLAKSMQAGTVYYKNSTGNGQDDMTKPVDFTVYPTDQPISVGNLKVNGRLAKFRREPVNVDPQTVWNTYMLGPGVPGVEDELGTDYHAKVSITRNGKTQRSVKLF